MAAFTEEQVKDFSIKNWYDLSGQVAVVTGGATGLGLAITRCLVSAGAKVAVVASRAPELVADTLAEFGGKAVYYQFNITDTDHAQELADKITAEQGPVSILVNNAGNHCKKFIWDMTVDDYKRVLDVHLVGAFALTKAFVPQMKEQGHGRIIFQASMTSYIGQPQVAGYSTAKAGYLGLIHTLTAELAEYGITIDKNDAGQDTLTLSADWKPAEGDDGSYTYQGSNDVDLTLQTNIQPPAGTEVDAAVQQQVLILQHSNG